MTMQRMIPVLVAAVLACDAEPEDVEAAEAPVAAAPVAAAPAAAPATQPAPAKLRGDAPVMPHAKQAFLKTLELIEKDYVERGLGEDALYTGAIEGVLARLIQLEGHPINELLDPQSYAELMHGTKGSIVGIGVEIGMRADLLTIIYPIPGGPAEKAGLKAGDRILAIDGVTVKGRELGEMVPKIRGAEGTEVDLFVQRDTEEWHQKVTRAQVAIANVESRLLDDGVGYVRLRGFAETTPAEFDAALEKMKSMRGLVLDLRDCPGGVLEASIELAGRFLADGQTIVTTIDRDGKKTTQAAKGDGRWQKLPLALLIGPNTASGAEIVADALRTHKRATLLGQKTFGKGTVEELHELGDGWAIKLSASRFAGASGELLHGRGVTPQLPVALPERTQAIAAIEQDEAVAAARTWLEGQMK